MVVVIKGASVHYKTIFISDQHLGSKGCKSDLLLDFLNKNSCEQLYLVGDVVDFWVIKNAKKWKKHHTEIVNLILEKAREGTIVKYTPGNHDDLVRKINLKKFDAVQIQNEFVHLSNGNKIMVVHGDIFDNFVMRYEWISKAATAVYDGIIKINMKLNDIRQRMGKYPIYFASAIKLNSKKFTCHAKDFKQKAREYAQKQGYDGIICGHLHHPEIIKDDDFFYANSGDWVENCSALVESQEGEFKIIHWRQC